MKASELFRKYPKTPIFDHSNYQLFERIPAVPGTSNNRGLTVFNILNTFNGLFHFLVEEFVSFEMYFLQV